jgi:hypothetical protein
MALFSLEDGRKALEYQLDTVVYNGVCHSKSPSSNSLLEGRNEESSGRSENHSNGSISHSSAERGEEDASFGRSMGIDEGEPKSTMMQWHGSTAEERAPEEEEHAAKEGEENPAESPPDSKERPDK